MTITEQERFHWRGLNNVAAKNNNNKNKHKAFIVNTPSGSDVFVYHTTMASNSQLMRMTTQRRINFSL